LSVSEQSEYKEREGIRIKILNNYSGNEESISFFAGIHLWSIKKKSLKGEGTR